MSNEHIDLETLSAFADGDLSAVNALRVERHLTECAQCRDALDRVRALVKTAAGLPREIAPPAVWGAIRDRVPVPSPQSPVPSRWWHNGWLASAAALLLIVGTASLMSLSH